MSDFSTARQKMVDGQVRPSDVTDLRIIDAMLAVPREEFVPASQRADGLSRPRPRSRPRSAF
jgi:protein-L-isoaspartate(D-aspartate) O-methyltransferase